MSRSRETLELSLVVRGLWRKALALFQSEIDGIAAGLHLDLEAKPVLFQFARIASQGGSLLPLRQGLPLGQGIVGNGHLIVSRRHPAGIQIVQKVVPVVVTAPGDSDFPRGILEEEIGLRYRFAFPRNGSCHSAAGRSAAGKKCQTSQEC